VPDGTRHASDALGLDPAQSLFGDNAPALVAAAIGLGYDSRAVYRAASSPTGCDVPALASLEELLILF
jgi:putative hydrolase of the HAD superfamily